jgi:hypothetical protein
MVLNIARMHFGKVSNYIFIPSSLLNEKQAGMKRFLLNGISFRRCWIFAGFQTRVAIPLRLNYPGTFSTHNTTSPGGYLPPPKDLRDLESRRRTWWTTIIFDRIVSVGGGIHAIDERDIGTELPLRGEDFDSEVRFFEAYDDPRLTSPCLAINA